MTCTSKQALFIENLQDRGATIPCKGDGDGPDFSMLDSVEQADAYIKQWMHLVDRGHRVTATAADWGGIPNC